MASDTFHPFARLPKELQDRIWDFAALSLNSHPAAHFFTFINTSHDAMSTLASKTIRHMYQDRYCLAAPQCSGRRKLSWTESNPSGYMSEIGLWNACTASRQRLQRCRRTSITWSDWINASCKSRFSGELDEAPILVEFLQDGRKQKFTINPKSDLVCLQPFDFDTISWSTIFAKGLRHLAFEFDPAWGSSMSDPWRFPCYDVTGPLRCIIEAAGFETDWVDNIWFIDYRISRRIGPAPNLTREVFNGNSCRFVEVRLEDSLWKRSSGESVFNFVENLECSLDDYFTDQQYYENRSYYPQTTRWGPPVGVLACEKMLE
ncbi:hypothetical protein GGS23DRAFT_557968 [Durotheca rogersii]|uniref:uncharacterized protein n=1 Tax=Durotheca rogersii TaxID=419775 RepID=UPI002220AEFC|nr:uncharacterized protein GGS23DRAFT_557968 [Durotheca rogersii]KAI5865160.1 hypothetical protein GGS23DRAFT_557968 [Durotheca rogersii]